MAPPITFFLSIDTLPRPTLWALPSPVVYNGTNVTFRCQGPLRSGRFQLWKDGELRDERNASRELAEFELRNVNGMTDARNYSCRYGQGPLWSDFSEPLALVVTGFFPQPQISTHIYLPVNPGRQVTILCKKLPSIFSQDYIFVLLEAESLKPLKKKSPTENTVFFTFPSVRIQDSGNYSCIYYKKTAPYIGSKPSQALKLTVLGKLPKPTLWTQSGLVVIPGTNITFWCSRPKLSFLKEVTFTLWRPWTGKYLNEQSSGELWTSFLLPSVRPGDTGSYRCTYKEMTASARNSENSDDLKLLVTGSLPKPTLSALPGLVVEPGTHVTLQCEHPPSYSSLWGVTFILLKVGISQPLQRQSPGGTSADFLLLSVRAQDAGSYSCVYHEEMMTLSQVSEPSEVLEIWVTDALPKASLSVRPVPEIASGVNVTLLCQGPSRGTGIVLYKEGGKQILPSMYTTQDGAQFSLTHVTPKHSGNYSCGYQPGTEGSLWTQLSDPLELIVRASESSNILIITLSCISFFLLLLCLLLLAFVCCGSIPMGSLQGDSLRRCFGCPSLPWSTCLPHNPETSREETLYTEVTEERSRISGVPMAEDPQRVIYTELKVITPEKRQTDPKESPTENIVYANLYLK